MRFVPRCFSKPAFILIWLLLLPSQTAKADHGDMIFMYSDQEPFIIATETELTGFLFDYINTASDLAGITPHWSNVPWEKQLPTLKRSNGNICALTLFKTPEREAYLKFSVPVGSSGRFVLVSVKNNERLLAHSSFKAVIEDPTLSPILQRYTKHSDYIDGLLAKKPVARTTGSRERIVRYMLDSPSKYLILSEVRTHYLSDIRGSDHLATYSHYPDLAGETFHYLGCSQTTEDGVLERLNATIQQLGLAKPKLNYRSKENPAN